MERLTSNKSAADMSMIELAHNCCFADSELNARYRDYGLDIDARELVKMLAKDMCNEDLTSMSDEEFDEYMGSMLSVEMDSPLGLLALFYRNLWAMADLRETLKKYEDLAEQGRLLKLPCKVGDRLYWINEEDDYGNEVLCIKQYGEDELVRAVGIDEDGDMFAMIGVDIDTEIPATIGSQYALLTMEDAEKMLEEMRGGKNG